MKALLSIALGSLMALPAMADLQTGLFRGKDASGVGCEVFVDSVWFDGIKHPLNERVTIKYGGFAWDLAHPSVVDETKGKVRFDHSFFRHIEPIDGGAFMITMKIDHDAKPHAPTALSFIEDNYRDATKSRTVVCTDLVHVP